MVSDFVSDLVSDPSAVEVSIALSSLIVAICYVAFIVAPAWASYGRVWERIAASVLTLFMLATLLMIGIVLGAAVVWTYDTWA